MNPLRADDVKRELEIPERSEAVAAIIVGKPQGEAPAVPRKPPEILSWIRSSDR